MVVVVAVVVVVVKDAPVIRSKGDGASNGRVAGSERLVVEETVEAAERKSRTAKNEKRALQCRSLACARGKQKQPNRNPTAAPLDIARRTLTTLPFK